MEVYRCCRSVRYVTRQKWNAQFRLSICHQNSSRLTRRRAKMTQWLQDHGGAVTRIQKTAMAGIYSAVCGTGSGLGTLRHIGSVVRSVLPWPPSETRMYPWVCISALSWTNWRRSETSAKPSRIFELNWFLLISSATELPPLSIRPSIR